METLQVEKTQVQTVYSKATPQEKSLLESLFGKDVISVNIMDRVKSFEDACQIVQPSENLKVLLNYPGIDKIMNTARAGAKLMIITKALNEGWFPDWTNVDEYKYYPWFYMDKNKYSPSGFGLYDVAYDRSNSDVGSRLCFKSEELAKYAATQFNDLYKEYLTA
jgi:hypothetical protein